MKLGVYAVFDNAVKAFLPPQVFRADGEAIRAFSAGVEAEGTPFAKHKQDYSLFRLGSFDDGFGSFENLTAPQMIATAISVGASVDVSSE